MVEINYELEGLKRLEDFDRYVADVFIELKELQREDDNLREVLTTEVSNQVNPKMCEVANQWVNQENERTQD